MDLQTLIATVESSSPSEWGGLNFQYVHGWEFGELKGVHYLKPITHTGYAVYEKDVSIAIAYGATCVENFVEDWSGKFADPHATSVHVVLLVNGNPVESWVHVYVDGARYLLPLPTQEGKRTFVPKSSIAIGRLMFGIAGLGGYVRSMEEVFKGVGVEIES